MKVLLLYDYPAPPGGLATQGELLYRGLRELGVEARATNLDSRLEKEWYYRWFKPDVVVGVGYWGKTPEIVLHPQEFGMTAVPWLVADGYIANYRNDLNQLPLILVTSSWVRDVYRRDGVRDDTIEVLPVGCDTQEFMPRSQDEPKIAAVRNTFGMEPDQIMILTVGGDGASKGAREVMQALVGLIPGKWNGKPGLPSWKYVVKVWPQERTLKQNKLDLELAQALGISDHVIYSTGRVSRDFMPYLFAACDIYAAPSRLEGFGMPQIESGACGKPVISIGAMGMLDTLIHEQTALLAPVAETNYIHETVLGAESGYSEPRRITFDPPRVADYRASVPHLRQFLERLLLEPELRTQLGEQARAHIVEHFEYKKVARRFLEIISQRLGIQ